MALQFQLCWNGILLVLSKKLHVSYGLYLHELLSKASCGFVALF